MEVDQAARTGDAPVREVMEERTGAEPVPEEVEERTKTEPVPEEVEERTGAEPVLEEVEEETGAMPVRKTGEGDLHFEDYPGDDFEKVEEFTPEETSQTPPTPISEHPAETPSSAKSRRKRFKTLAGRTYLPWVQKLAALKAKTSSSSQQTPQK